MRKKLILIIAIVVIIVILLSAILIIRSNSDINYYLIKDGYGDIKSKILSSYEDYKDFVEYINSENEAYGMVYKFDSTKYDSKYFASKSLAIINVVIGSSMNKFKGIDFSIRFDKLICKPDIKYSKSSVVTADITGKVYLVEINKDVTNFEIN